MCTWADSRLKQPKRKTYHSSDSSTQAENRSCFFTVSRSKQPKRKTYHSSASSREAENRSYFFTVSRLKQPKRKTYHSSASSTEAENRSYFLIVSWLRTGTLPLDSNACRNITALPYRFDSNKNKTGKEGTNVTLKCVRVTAVGVEKH